MLQTSPSQPLSEKGKQTRTTARQHGKQKAPHGAPPRRMRARPPAAPGCDARAPAAPSPAASALRVVARQTHAPAALLEAGRTASSSRDNSPGSGSAGSLPRSQSRRPDTGMCCCPARPRPARRGCPPPDGCHRPWSAGAAGLAFDAGLGGAQRIGQVQHVAATVVGPGDLGQRVGVVRHQTGAIGLGQAGAAGLAATRASVEPSGLVRSST